MEKIFSDNLINNSAKRSNFFLLQWLLEPSASITDISKRRHARLVSAMLLFCAVSMISGVIYMGYFNLSPKIGLILGITDIGFIISYILSRTRFHQQAIILFLILIVLIPVFNITLETNHSPERLLLLLIWNAVTIHVCSIVTSIRNTLIYLFINNITVFLFPVFIPTVLFINIIIPVIFNITVSCLILINLNFRNQLQKDRLFEISHINDQLKSELLERERVEGMIAHTATHDPLTNLPNRVLFMDRLQHVLDSFNRHKEQMFAVLFLDLDRFKEVNDTLGHDSGDLLLIEAATRMTSCLRGQDTVARFGGDEFVILLEDIQDSAQSTYIADRIQDDLSRPFDLKGHNIHIFVSIGIVMVRPDYERAEEILRDADIAMYHSKGKGLGRYEFFNPVMLEHVINQVGRERDLRKAIEKQELIVHYQPIRNMKTNLISGFEALVRWQHPKLGLLQPAEFITIAENTGLIIPIGYWVMNEACRQIRIWQKQFISDPPLVISVNLSTRQFTQNDLVQKIEDILKKNELNPSTLKLELTESLVVKDQESAYIMLSKLREMGIEVQIDDFGTGYSSLGYLHTLPIDTLKIDRIFINRLGNDKNGSAIVRTILALAHNLNMKVIAEGVETETQLSELIAMNCEYVQGFLFSEPVGPADADVLLRQLFNEIKK
jgi:diguanylate cyclase (GGDEF)-like protein